MITAKSQQEKSEKNGVSDKQDFEEKLIISKKKREDALEEARKLSNINKEQIAKFKECLRQASEEKRKRDEENAVVKALVEERRGIWREISGLKQAIEVKEKLLSQLDFKENPLRIQERLEKLEWAQQTEALNAREEREVSKQIRELRSRLQKSEQATVLFSELRELHARRRELIEKSRELSARISEHTKASDAHHSERARLLEKAKRLEEKISEYFTRLSAARDKASEQHREFVDALRALHDLEDYEAIRSLAAQRARERRIRAQLGARAQKLLEEFRGGKKLSFEELQVLQEAGVF